MNKDTINKDPNIKDVVTIDVATTDEVIMKEFKNSITISEMQQNVDVLDLVLFRGSDLVSSIILGVEVISEVVKGNKFKQLLYKINNLLCQGRCYSQPVAIANLANIDVDNLWTHVGIIVTPRFVNIRNLRVTDDNRDKLYILESTASGMFTDGIYNVETGTSDICVQIRDFEAVARAYLQSEGSRIAISKLRDNPCARKHTDEDNDKYTDRFDTNKKILYKCYEKYIGRSYDGNPISLLSAVFDCCKPRRDKEAVSGKKGGATSGDTGNLFCSELIAAIYKQFGIIEESVNPSDIAPMEFMSDPKLRAHFEDMLLIIKK